MPSWMYRRCYWTGHSRDGFHLSVMDRWLPAVVAEGVVNTLLAALGHPRCGRGIGRIPGVDYVAYLLLDAPNRLCQRDREVLKLPVTEGQALTIEPSWAESTWWRDDEAEEASG